MRQLNILDTIRKLGRAKDFGQREAAEKLRGAIIRLRKQNPFRLSLPEGGKRGIRETARES